MKPARRPACLLLALGLSILDSSPARPDRREGLHVDLQTLGFYLDQDVGTTRIDPLNQLGLARHQYQLHLRPDLEYRLETMELSLKPRAILNHRQFDDGVRSGDEETSITVFLNEGFFRYRFGDTLFLSYGRENLQWGPAYLLSVSNPFQGRNGRTLPQIEIPGLEHARAVWLPTNGFTLSLIANLGPGHLDVIGPYDQVYALKADLTGDRQYGSLILSAQERKPERLGGYYVRTVTEPLMVYLEGQLARGESATVLTGVSYTFTGGEVLAFEYLHDGPGQALLTDNLPVPSSLARSMGMARSRDLAMLQISRGQVSDRLGYTLRADRDLDDPSTRLIGLVSYSLGDSTEVYVSTVFNLGDPDTTFRNILDRVILAGAKLTF